MNGIDRIRRSPVTRLAAYYLLLAGAAALLVRLFPTLEQAVSLSRLRELSGMPASLGRGVESLPADFSSHPGVVAAITLVAMVGALAFVLPVAWVYMITKQRRGYDQSVVQTVIILPMVVAATVMIVQSNLALAFGLAAIVGAVRFRNTLKDTKDSVYLFLALGVGLAAGVQALSVSAVMSVLFNVVVLMLWKFNVGNIYADQLGRTPALRPAEALLGPGKGAEPLAVGDPELLAALTPDELDEVADRAARLQAYVAARAGDEKKKRFNGVLLVHATQLEAAQRAAEAALDDHAKRWKLAEILRATGGRATLEYLIRLKDDSLAATLLDALKTRGAPHVVAAEFKTLRGLKPKES